MNKELEALKRLLPYLPEGDLLEDEVRILTLALERKEKLEKVWNIVKTKRVSMVNAFFTNCVEEYNGALGTDIELTKKEYDLLKEELENAEQ